jgi:hypothetical protein
MFGPPNILQPSQISTEDCKPSPFRGMTKQQLQFEQRVDDKIDALLARCDRLLRGSDLHVMFDAQGEAAARAIAECDQENN